MYFSYFIRVVVSFAIYIKLLSQNLGVWIFWDRKSSFKMDHRAPKMEASTLDGFNINKVVHIY